MASTITISVDESKISIKALSYRQSKAVKRRQDELNEQYPRFKELQRMELLEDGLEPKDMLELRDMEESMMEELEPLMLETIRMGIAKLDSKYAIPNETEGVSTEDIDLARRKAIEEIEDMFTISQIKAISEFVITGFIDKATLKDIDGK